MRNKQRGVTVIGWLILLIPFAIVGYAGIRLLPLYLNYMKVTRTLDQVHGELRGAGGDTAEPSATRSTSISTSTASIFPTSRT